MKRQSIRVAAVVVPAMVALVGAGAAPAVAHANNSARDHSPIAVTAAVQRYVNNTNDFQTVSLGPDIHDFGSHCPDTFAFAANWKLGLDGARGDWVHVRWVKIGVFNHHKAEVAALGILGSGGGIAGYTVNGPFFPANYDGHWELVGDFPVNGVDVKWDGDSFIVDTEFLYAKDNQTAPFTCKDFNSSYRVIIIR